MKMHDIVNPLFKPHVMI